VPLFIHRTPVDKAAIRRHIAHFFWLPLRGRQI